MKIDERLQLLLLKDAGGSDDLDFTGYGQGDVNLGRVWLAENGYLRRKEDEQRGDDTVKYVYVIWYLTPKGRNRIQELEQRGVSIVR